MRRFSPLIICLIAASSHAQITLPWYLGAPGKRAEAASAINAEQLVLTKPNREIVVAVIDSGVRADHPSLRGKLLPGMDMVSAVRNPRNGRSSDFSPDNQKDACPTSERVSNREVFGHGTGVASVIAGNGALDVIGVNPQVKIVPIKVMGACPASRVDLMDALLWAGGVHVDGLKDNEHPARIINVSMSGGNTNCDGKLQEVINTLLEKGIIIVSAAGNTFGKSAREPSVCTGVIGVGAINPDKSVTYYTAIDDRILIYAPGGGSESPKYGPSIKNRIRIAAYSNDTQLPVGADEGLGTSYSSALVTGVIAGLVLEQPTMTAKTAFEEIRSLDTMLDNDSRRNLNYEYLVRLMRSHQDVAR